MKRFGWISGVFLIVVLLIAIEIAVIANASGYEAKEKVVFARIDIDKNVVIRDDMLELREIGRSVVHPEALKSISEADLKISAMDIEAGEMLLKGKLSSDERGIIQAEDKSNRLFSVKFEIDQANGWQLANGQYVDVIYVPNKSEQSRKPAADVGEEAVETALIQEASSVKVLKNIRIAGLINEDGKLIEDLQLEATPRYVSFEVTEEQALFLAYAKSNGKLELSSISE